MKWNDGKCTMKVASACTDHKYVLINCHHIVAVRSTKPVFQIFFPEVKVCETRYTSDDLRIHFPNELYTEWDISLDTIISPFTTSSPRCAYRTIGKWDAKFSEGRWGSAFYPRTSGSLCQIPRDAKSPVTLTGHKKKEKNKPLTLLGGEGGI